MPGPGSYDYDNKKYFSRIGGLLSRQSRSESFDTKTPGPGNYDVNQHKLKIKDPAWSLGPGHYNPKE